MTDYDVDVLTTEALDDLADDFADAQRKAFVTGFEYGVNQAEEMDILVEFLKKERDKAAELHDEHEDPTLGETTGV